jgi:hypothetical protein
MADNVEAEVTKLGIKLIPEKDTKSFRVVL